MRRTRAERGFSIALGMFVCVLAAHLFIQSPFFRIRTITVQGAVSLPETAIVALTRIQPGMYIFDVDLGAAEQHILAEPRFAAARVRRLLPAHIDIRVEERRPVAQLAVAGTLWLLDETGYILGENSAGLSLPVIVVAEATGAVRPGEMLSPPALRAAAGLAADLPAGLLAGITEIRAGAVDNLELITGDGLVIRFGSWSDVQLKANVALSLLEQLQGKKALPRCIDISRPESPVVW